MTPFKRPNPGTGLGLVGLLVASLLACTGAISGQAPSGSGGSIGNGTGGSGNGNGSGGSGNGSGSGGSGTPDGGTPTASVGQSNIIACVNGIAPTTQIPRMTDAQYDNVINDLVG